MQKISNLITSKGLYMICRVVLGAVFIYASWDKILDPKAFARIIENYQIVSSDVGRTAALFLPWLELVSGICLIIHRWTRGSALIVAGLMVVFMSALGYNIYQGIDVSCGCFTLNEQAPGSMWWYMVRDVLFLTMALVVVVNPGRGRSIATPA